MAAKATSTRQPSLVNQLADRIRNRTSLEEPYMVEDRVQQTGSRHVAVIWDAWADLDRPARGRIIADAYHDAGIQDTITVALGITQQEALELGYLPYQIAANWKASDGQGIRVRLRRALETAPGVHVKTGSSQQLRYPTLGHAQEAYRHLSQQVPGPYWAIIKEDRPAE